MIRLIFPLVLSLAGCAAPGGPDSAAGLEPEVFTQAETARARELLVGRWYGDQLHDDGERQRWLVHRGEDGTYLIEFQVIKSNGAINSWAEVGIWGVRKPIYFTAVRGFVDSGRVQPANTTRAELYDTYRILDLTPFRFTYVSHTSGTRFTVNRVAEDFEL